MIEAPNPQAEQPTPYTPAGPPDPLIFEMFEGINTATLRPGVDDKQMAWCDGFMPLGPGRNLRTMYGIQTPALFTPTDGSLVSLFAFFNIGATPYMLTVQSSGSIYAVNTNTGSRNQDRAGRDDRQSKPVECRDVAVRQPVRPDRFQTDQRLFHLGWHDVLSARWS